MKPLSCIHKSAALTLIELLVVVAILVILGALFLPAHGTKVVTTRIVCAHNLHQVSLSFLFWAGDNTNAITGAGQYPMAVSTNKGGTLEYNARGVVFRTFQVMSNELSTPKILVCPSDTRLAATNFTTGFSNSNLSYFVGLDADESNPQMMLAGDRNIVSGKQPVNGILTLTSNDVISWTREMHKLQGNVAMADGSVRQLTASELQQTLRGSGAATNRLALP